MAESPKPRVVGFNHVALEVGDIDEALAFYGQLFDFELRGKSDTMAFSTSAISSSRSRRGAGKPLTTVATSASWSRARRPRARR
jgi:predicted enzyme related to lactoylglutathione lyase